jgi:hypothetical protein
MLPHMAAEAPAPLEAEAHLVRMYSAVARQLPETEEWDLSGLLVDGQPVSRATVVAWLNAAYQHAYEADFEQQDDSSASSAEGLYSLLAFADAVGSTKPLLKVCCAAALDDLQLRVQLGQQEVQLKTDGTGYFFGVNSQLHVLEDCSKPANPVVNAHAASAEEQQAFKQEVAAQTEQLLWLAYRLQLQPLAWRLQNFVRSQSWWSSSFVSVNLSAVFTQRVQEAAGVAGLPYGAQLLLNSVLGELASLTNRQSGAVHSVGTVLLPTDLTKQQKQPIKFQATVQRSTLNLAEETVTVELDLFGRSLIKLGYQTYPVQLRIGNSVG